MKKRRFFVLRGKPTPFMNAPLAVKKSYLANQRSTVKRFVKAFADATRFIVDNRDGTTRPLTNRRRRTLILFFNLRAESRA